MQLETTKEAQQKFLAGGEPTLNNTGYMTGNLDPYSREFVEYAGKVKGRVLDIGACYGVATIPALEQGATVVATDNDIRHLEILRSRVPSEEQKRLQTVVGALPNDLHFPQKSFSAILCCRVLHLLKEDEIEQSLQHMYTWLEEGGRLYLVNDTPYARYSDKMLTEFLPIYEQRKKDGIKWPGFIPDLKMYLQPEFHHLSPDFITLTGISELTQACENCGFKILRAEYVARPDYPPSLQNDGRENVGVIAIKT